MYKLIGEIWITKKKYELIVEENRLKIIQGDKEITLCENLTEFDIEFDNHAVDSVVKKCNFIPTFGTFWDKYHIISGLPKTDIMAAKRYFNVLSLKDKRLAFKNINHYCDSVEIKRYTKKARTYLRDKNFLDEFKCEQHKPGWI